MTPSTPVPAIAAAGIPTTTPIAFVLGGVPYLERINVLAIDGCGVLSGEVPPIGTVVPVVFHLSTARRPTRCTAEVLGTIPTTPTGLELQKKHGDKALPAITGAGVSDSATAIFRLGDLERKPAPEAKRDEEVEAAIGFSLHFLDLDARGRSQVQHHMRHSQMLADRLAAQGGRTIEQERPAIADTFTEGDLSKRALDW